MVDKKDLKKLLRRVEIVFEEKFTVDKRICFYMTDEQYDEYLDGKGSLNYLIKKSRSVSDLKHNIHNRSLNHKDKGHIFYECDKNANKEYSGIDILYENLGK